MRSPGRRRCPRSNGELVFDEPWQGRALGMAVLTVERTGTSWSEWSDRLGAAIAARGFDPRSTCRDRVLHGVAGCARDARRGAGAGLNPYAGLIRTLGRTRAFGRVAAPLLHRLDGPFRHHRRSPDESRYGFPLCYLTVRGRRSGELRTVPLLHVADGERVILIGSNFGRPDHPAWALNLEAAGASVGCDRRRRARVLGACGVNLEERERYWGEALRVWPGYEGYRRRVTRRAQDVRARPLDRCVGRSRHDRRHDVEVLASQEGLVVAVDVAGRDDARHARVPGKPGSRS